MSRLLAPRYDSIEDCSLAKLLKLFVDVEEVNIRRAPCCSNPQNQTKIFKHCQQLDHTSGGLADPRARQSKMQLRHNKEVGPEVHDLRANNTSSTHGWFRVEAWGTVYDCSDGCQKGWHYSRPSSIDVAGMAT